MSEEILNGYGQDFLRTFKQRWPRSVELVVYLDSGWTNDVADRYPWVSFARTRDVAFHDEWMARIAPFPLMRGDVGDGKYSIQFDARQARKVFIEAHAAETFGGKVFWIDADVVTHAPVTTDFLDTMLPDSKMSCFLGRGDWMYSETGFVGYNTDHPAIDAWVKSYRKVYLTGAIFTQHGWHDCYGYDLLRLQLPAKWFNNLAEGLPAGTMHPFISSPLGAVMDHRKGGRKKTRSTKADLVVERSEPYWQFEVPADAGPTE